MDTQTTNILIQLTNSFYEHTATSFSATRHAAWSGWQRCLDFIAPALRIGAAWKQQHSNIYLAELLDLACGNLRFETFLSQALPDLPIHVTAVDSCEDLMYRSALAIRSSLSCSLHTCNVLTTHQPFTTHLVDAAVAFGFLHHVPGISRRISVLNMLASATRSGGVLAVSLWRFLDDGNFAQRARADHDRLMQEIGLDKDTLSLDPGDYLLGWQNEPQLARYCHHFTDDEEHTLIDTLSDQAKLLDRFRSDGKNNMSNSYLIFRVI